MIYAPHELQIRTVRPLEKDEFGRSIPGTGGVSWTGICRCRCDDNSTKEFVSENGSVYRPAYHVICEGRVLVNAGDFVQCSGNDSIIATGKVCEVKRLSWYDCVEIWM